ncbi:unnamed protein product [Linum tenue]|uniref:C2 NT-type domain-containing protein n=1 Tax=Linum tenue TaxID=586396 RepID=A0AAV0QP07_9ROSI|nr:unnamed protein product [Linum tenue]
MFKSWRSKEKKFKAVFQLQFQATQVPQLKKPALTVSLVPEDVGKPTFKLQKTAVQDGNCLWENPIYVTVKLVREPKTGKLHEKIYHFIVSSGSAKKDYLGESSIDFADFADENEPMTVSLPLKFANSGAVLHITVHKIQGGIDQRNRASNGEAALPQDERLMSLSSNDRSDIDDKNFAEEIDDFEEEDNFKASIGSNESSFKSVGRQNSMPQRASIDVNSTTTKNRLHRRSNTEWSMASASDESLVDSTNSPGDDNNNVPKQFHEGRDQSVQKLKSEIFGLMRQSELSEMELQTLRKQVTKETKRAQDLSKEMMDIKEERDALERECEQLKLSRKTVEAEALDRVKTSNEGSRVKIEEMRKELAHEKELKVNLELQLQKTQESNSELILAVQDLDDMLKGKSMEISMLTSKLEESYHQDKEVHCQKCSCNTETDENQDDTTTSEALREQIADMSDEIEAYKESRGRLEKYIEHLTQDYEDLKQENLEISSELEENMEQNLKVKNERSEHLAIIGELESQLRRVEHKMREQTEEQSESLLRINELEGQVKALEKELEKQAVGFERDLYDLTQAKIEQEQRAVRAEEALRKTMWENGVTAERLQEEFKKLSQEMASKIEDNEKHMTSVHMESEKLREQNGIMEEKLNKAYEEVTLIRDQNKVRVEELLTQLDLRTKMMEEISLEVEEKSMQLESVQKREKERQEAFSREIQMLKAKLEAHTTADTSKQTSLGETTLEIGRQNEEKKELDRKYSSAKQEAEEVREELENLRSMKDERETMLMRLQLEIEGLKDQHNKLKHSLSEEELEKESLRKQILKLNGELQKKEDDRLVADNEVIDNWKAKTHTEQLLENCNLTEMLDEIAQIKERNRRMESELKEMEVRYSDISLKFAEVEGERQQLVMTVRNLKIGKKS